MEIHDIEYNVCKQAMFSSFISQMRFDVFAQKGYLKVRYSITLNFEMRRSA